MAVFIEKELEKINQEVRAIGFGSVGEAMVSMQSRLDRIKLAMLSGGNSSMQYELEKINNELKPMGFNSFFEAYGAMQEKIKRMVKVQRDGAKAEGVIKKCGKCQAIGEKRCTGNAFLPIIFFPIIRIF